MSAQMSFDVLFRGSDPQNVNFKPVFDMAAEFFTHLGVACELNCPIAFRCLTTIDDNAAVMNPGGQTSRTSTGSSVSDVVDEETDKLLRRVNEEGDFGKRHGELLKALVGVYYLGVIPFSLSPYRAVI